MNIFQLPITQGRCSRTSGGQRAIDNSCMVRSRWECYVGFDTVIRLDHTVAVGHRLLLWVGDRWSKNGQVWKFGVKIAPP